MSRRRRQSSSEQLISQLRDYAVPIIGLMLVLFIIFNVFTWEESSVNSGSDNNASDNILSSTSSMSLDFDTEETWWVIEQSDWSTDKLEEQNALLPWEKLIIDRGNVTLKSEGLLMKLNKNWELKFDKNGDYLLTSSDLFVDAKDAINMNLRFFNLKLLPGAIVSLNQNEVASTVNVLSWKAEASTFSWKQIMVAGWNRLSISNVESTQEDIDIEWKKEEIWNYFFSETWAQDNDLISYLNKEEETESVETWTGETVDEPVTTEGTTSWEYISFTWLEDNKTYGTSTIDLKGSLNDERVSKVTFNAKEASLNLVGKTYELNGFAIPLLENDVVYKAYDAGGNILDRGVFTVFYKEWAETPAAVTTTVSDTTDFPVDDSNPQFTFTAPTPNPYTSTAAFITIRGQATAGSAASVTVNGLKLQSFNGTTWRYHASTQFGTLKNGVNLYKVNYYDTTGNIVHTNTFTIIRKTPPVAIATTPVVKTVPVAPTPVPAKVPAPVVEEKSDTANSGGDTIANRIPLD